MRILLDVMGGDRSPKELIQGGVSSAHERNIDLLIAGDPDLIRSSLASHGEREGSRFSILPSTQVVQMADPPVRAVRDKKQSSLVLGLEALRAGDADAFVSPANTGAVVAGSIFQLGRIHGIPRPGIAVPFPTLPGRELILIDVGANSDCVADHLLHFAKMGLAYARKVLGIEKPSVGLLNIGAEEGKGNRLIRNAFDMLRQSDLPFVGNVEAHHLLTDRPADVVVCDGFVGNVFLKAVEGGVNAVTSLLRRSIRERLTAKLGALFMRGAFRKLRETLSYRSRGGAPLLGVDGAVVIAHGRSDAEAISSAIDVACREVETGLLAHLAEDARG